MKSGADFLVSYENLSAAGDAFSNLRSVHVDWAVVGVGFEVLGCKLLGSFLDILPVELVLSGMLRGSFLLTVGFGWCSMMTVSWSLSPGVLCVLFTEAGASVRRGPRCCLSRSGSEPFGLGLSLPWCPVVVWLVSYGRVLDGAHMSSHLISGRLKSPPMVM